MGSMMTTMTAPTPPPAPVKPAKDRSTLWFVAIFVAIVVALAGFGAWHQFRSMPATATQLSGATTACEDFLNGQMRDTGTYSGERATGSTKHITVVGLVEDSSGTSGTYTCKVHPTDGGLLWHLDSMDVQ